MAPKVPTSLGQTLDCKQGAVRAARFNVDGNYGITCGADKTVKLWNAERNLLLKCYTGHGYEVMDAAGSCDNAHLASGGLDKTIFYWDVSTGKPVHKYRGHLGFVNAVAFNEDSSLILSASVDGTVRAWDCRSKNKDPVQILEDASDSVTSIAVTDHEILTGSADARIRRYDLRAGQLYEDYVGASATSVNFSRDGQCVLVSTLDSTIRLLDKDTGELLSDYTSHVNKEYKIDSVLGHDDSYIIAGSEDGNIYFWDLVDGTVIGTVTVPVAKVVHSLSAHPTQPSLLAACLGKVYLYSSNQPLPNPSS